MQTAVSALRQSRTHWVTIVPMVSEHPVGMRLDKWLWAARFYKTRSLATDEIGKGRVNVNGQVAKASRELRVTDTVEIGRAHV